MKVALCISGQMRTFDKVFPALKRNLIDVLNPDIFISTWSKIGKTHKTNTASTPEWLDLSPDALSKLTNAKIVDIEEFKDEFYDSFKNVHRPIYLKNNEPIHSRSMIPHFYKIHRCNELRKAYSMEMGIEYDCVIRLRPDLLLGQSVESLFKEVQLESNVYISLCGIDPTFQISDKFAIMNSEMFDYYCSIWEKLEFYWSSPSGKNPPKTNRVGERLMFEHFRPQEYNLKYFNLRSKIIR